MEALKVPILGEVSPVVLLGGAVVALLVARQLVAGAADVAAGIVTGDNAVTRNATDADGNKVTAYQGAGILGTAGATANAASGGALASVGKWLGAKVYDLVHGDPAEDTSAPAPSASPPAAAAVVAAPNPADASFQDQSQSSWNWSGWTGWGAVR